MNSIYIIAIVLQVGILGFFIRRALKKKPVGKKEELPIHATEYERTRHTALQVTQQQLGLDIPHTVTKVYGVIMDWDMSGTVLTLSAYITGAANVALSSGAALTGGGKNPAVAELAADFVQVAQGFIIRTVPGADTGLPPIGAVRFYLLTNKGMYVAQEVLAAIDDGSSPWTPLFFRGNMVIEEIKQGASRNMEN